MHQCTSFRCTTSEHCRGDACVAPTGVQRWIVQVQDQGNDWLVCHDLYPARFDITCCTPLISGSQASCPP